MGSISGDAGKSPSDDGSNMNHTHFKYSKLRDRGFIGQNTTKVLNTARYGTLALTCSFAAMILRREVDHCGYPDSTVF